MAYALTWIGFGWMILFFIAGEISYVRARTGSMIWRMSSAAGGPLLILVSMALMLLGY